MTTITRHLGNGDEANQETVLPFCSTGEHSGTDSRTLALTLLPFCSKGERLEAQSLLSEQSALDASTILSSTSAALGCCSPILCLYPWNMGVSSWTSVVMSPMDSEAGSLLGCSAGAVASLLPAAVWQRQAA